MAVRTRCRAAIIASFAADAVSLGTHWEYSTDKIKQQFPQQLKQLHSPLSSYHSGKKAGDLTHIGDNARYLLQYIAHTKSPHHFDPITYTEYWYEIWKQSPPPAYVDHVSKDKIKQIQEAQQASPSIPLSSLISSLPTAICDDDDLSHSSKLFVLLALPYTTEDDFVADAIKLVQIFQRGTNESTTAAYLAHVIYRVIHQQMKPDMAIKTIDKEMNNEFIHQCLKKAEDSLSLDDATTALRSYGEKKIVGEGRTVYMGLTCGVRYGLPAVMRSVLAHSNDTDPSNAIIEDINIGGNCNGRSIAIATILFGAKGSIKGTQAETWWQGMTHREEIESLLDTIDANSKDE